MLMVKSWKTDYSKNKVWTCLLIKMLHLSTIWIHFIRRSSKLRIMSRKRHSGLNWIPASIQENDNRNNNEVHSFHPAASHEATKLLQPTQQLQTVHKCSGPIGAMIGPDDRGGRYQILQYIISA
jgi:hypothetical protein